MKKSAALGKLGGLQRSMETKQGAAMAALSALAEAAKRHTTAVNRERATESNFISGPSDRRHCPGPLPPNLYSSSGILQYACVRVGSYLMGAPTTNCLSISDVGIPNTEFEY